MSRFFFLFLAIFPLVVFGQGAGSLWEPMPLKFDGQVRTLYTDSSTGDLYITNFLGNVDGKDSSVVKWNGHQATFIQPPFDDGINIVKHKGKLIVSGISYGPPAINKIASFDGLSWVTLALSRFDEASPIAIIDSNIVVTGIFDTIAGHPIKSAALWDGDANWRDLYKLDTCMPGDPFINAAVKYKGEVYVGGNIYSTDLTTHIARFNGTNWKDVGGGMRGDGLSWVSSMLLWKGELYVAGQFFERNGSPGNCIAKWDGLNWHRLGSGINPGGGNAGIYDMAIYRDRLYVVGVFSIAGGVNANNIAEWDGSRWCSLNTDFNQGTPSQIEVAKGELYISGSLWTINGDTVFNMAHWIGGDYVYECGLIEPTAVAEISNPEQTLLLYPNPADDVLYAKWNDIQNLYIYDATGKIIKTVTAAELKSGILVSRWPIGLYFAKAILRNGVIVRSKFMKI